MSKEQPISLLLFDAIDTFFMYETIYKHMFENEYIIYHYWYISSIKDQDTFRLITKKYYSEYFNYNVTSHLCCMVIYDNINNVSSNIITKYFKEKILSQNYMKPIFFSENPEYDLDTFNARCCIESKFKNLRWKYELINPSLEITQPTFSTTTFSIYWNRTKLPENYRNLIQNLCDINHDVTLKVYSYNIFELSYRDANKLYCLITSNVIFIWGYRPISLSVLMKLYDYIYVVAYALIPTRGSLLKLIPYGRLYKVCIMISMISCRFQ